MLASIIITTYNRCDALIQSLEALSHQTIEPSEYEIVVVDDGSTDETFDKASSLKLPCGLKVFRHRTNLGIAAGRNLAIRNATGRYLIMVSDDLLVPANFIESHIETLERFPGWWVVCSFKQLDSLNETPFGRYLDQVEKNYERMHAREAIGDGLWELGGPTARNLSLPRADLDLTGLFDEQFRHSCEDQDLAHRARQFGIRFLYNSAITCLHNDQAGDLKRCCRQQRRFAEQTVAFCDKYPAVHGDSELSRVNGYIASRDSIQTKAKKVAKWIISRDSCRAVIEALISTAEFFKVPDGMLFPMYRFLIGLYIFRGWRDGLGARATGSVYGVQSLSRHTDA